MTVEGADSGEVVDAPSERLAVSLDPRSMVGVVVGMLALFLFAAFFAATGRAVTIVLVGVLLAFAIEPLVLAVEKRSRASRGTATAVVALAVFLAFGALAVLVGPPAAQQAQRFGTELPQTLRDLEDLPLVGDRLADADAAEKVQDWIDTLPGRIDAGGVTDAARQVLNGLLNGGAVLLVAFAVLLDGPKLVDRFRLVIPERHRPKADAAGRVFYRVIGTYFAGSLLVASIGGTWVLIVGLAMGVPLAPIAAVWYATVSLIPQIGGFLGTSFVTILALSQGLVPGLVVLVLVVLYMNLENYVISPAIVGDAVDLSPPTTMIAALIGGAAAGVPGALAATPLCGTVKALYLEARYGAQPEVEATRFRDRIKLPGPLKKLLGRT